MSDPNKPIRIRTSEHLIELPWDSAQDLIGRLLMVVGMKGLVEALRLHGSKHTVTLSEQYKAPLDAVLGFWAQDIGEDLPPGIS